MECPGSVGLLKTLSLPATDEPDYRAEGTAAHHFLEWCLRHELDAWEVIGRRAPNGIDCTVEMSDAIQVFLDIVRPTFLGSEVWIEASIGDPSFHPLFYGQLDCGVLSQVKAENAKSGVWLEVNDFKYGQGVIVEVWHNPQIMYYAYGLLRELDARPQGGDPVEKVKLRIIQPRGFHPDGPIREWVVDADVIRSWATGTLRPAMERVATDSTLSPGAHCRFCPAKLVCPVMVSLFEAAIGADPKRLVEFSDAAIDAQYPMVEAVKFYTSALEADVLRRLANGSQLAHAKLVHKKANRVWKDGAAAVLKAQFGDDKLYDPPSFKSPAEVEKLGGVAKTLVHEYAFTPESGLTVASMSDKRVAVKVRGPEETFATFLKGV